MVRYTEKLLEKGAERKRLTNQLAEMVGKVADEIAQNAPDNFAKLLVVGIMSWIIIQAFVNIGAMVGLLPLTGVPLPFISYGGTAMAVLMAACGIIINISRKTCMEV